MDYLKKICEILATFKVILLTFKALHGLAPPYLRDLLTLYTSARPLRSQGQNLLTPVQSRLKNYGDRAFQCAAPKLWNNLPPELRHIENLAPFKKALKTLKFKEAYSSM